MAKKKDWQERNGRGKGREMGGRRMGWIEMR